MFRRNRRVVLTPEQLAEKAANEAAFKASQRECQICERHQCLSAKGKMVLHGYKRPGYGFIEGSCFGVGFVNYTRGVDALVQYAELLDGMLASANEYLALYTRGEVTHFDAQTGRDYARDASGRIAYVGRQIQYVPVYTSFAPGVSDPTMYAAKLQAKHDDARMRVEAIENEIKRVAKRIAAQPAAAAKEAKAKGKKS